MKTRHSSPEMRQASNRIQHACAFVGVINPLGQRKRETSLKKKDGRREGSAVSIARTSILSASVDVVVHNATQKNASSQSMPSHQARKMSAAVELRR